MSRGKQFVNNLILVIEEDLHIIRRSRAGVDDICLRGHFVKVNAPIVEPFVYADLKQKANCMIQCIEDTVIHEEGESQCVELARFLKGITKASDLTKYKRNFLITEDF